MEMWAVRADDGGQREFILSGSHLVSAWLCQAFSMLYWCYNILTSPPNPTTRKDTNLAKVNYQYEKRQKELEKKRKKEQKEKLKQLKKNVQTPKETDETPQVPPPEK